MRLLYLADPFLPIPPLHYGGIERIVDLLAREAIARGHQVALLAHPQSSVASASLFPLVGGAKPSPVEQAQNLFRVARAVREFRPDLVHSFARLAYLLPLLPRRLCKIMSYQRVPTTRTIRTARFLAGASLRFTACSDAMRRLGEKGGGRWSTIPNGIDLDRYAFRPIVALEAPLVFLSRFEPIKGAHLAIAVARKSGRRLILAGNRVDSAEGRAYWQNKIAPLVDGNQIRYVGPVNDTEKSALLGSAAALLVPVQWDEPFGIVFIEALACGTPVLASPRGALPEIIEHGRHGFLCRELTEFVAAVQQLPALSREACRERALRCFSRPVIFDQYEKLYRSN